ncbi:MAG: hypothetical protein P4M11_14180 [Candidatus Pacebacteria bacterium]|nr:hypothetical protein [Candidatus Paceibacterota bacterium]
MRDKLRDVDIFEHKIVKQVYIEQLLSESPVSWHCKHNRSISAGCGNADEPPTASSTTRSVPGPGPSSSA